MASCATLWFNYLMWTEYISPSSLQEALRVLSQKPEKTRVVAGATDLMLELERGVRKGIQTIVDITRLPGLDQVTLDEHDSIHIGPLVTHNAVVASRVLRERAFPLLCAAWQVGAPQIRNRATVAGNLITASPANDTIPPLMVLGAVLTLTSLDHSRQVALKDFYTGVRRTVMQPDEILTDITFPALKPGQHGIFLKLGLRRAQAISLVNTAILLDLEATRVKTALITLGAVAPTIIHALEAETYLCGKELTDEVIRRASELAANASRPIDDIRGSAAYRHAMVRVLVQRGLQSLRSGQEKSQVPDAPVLLWGREKRTRKVFQGGTYVSGSPIHTNINGRKYLFTTGHEKSLLRLLREEAGLTGTKEGCAEGECGACTVFLDGKAVMACLVPAPRADGATIVTVEGLENPTLHPVQEAFIKDGAVQCGYCTPGFIMSAVKLLEERPHPARENITQAISGNLCRCTGYYKIVQAIEDASNS
jgi:xanthine dehydrogenase iron-sulfur cluster and FAD-binding subunit A